MARYIRRLTHIGSAGPTEERGFAIWAGYEIVGVEDDLSATGLIKVEGWSDDELAARGVTRFLRVDPENATLYEKLGIGRSS